MKRVLAVLGVLLLTSTVACDRGGRSSRGVGAAAMVGPAGPQGPQGPPGARGLPASGTSNLPIGVFDVTDFGAQGNGVTDDTAAIQAAIDAAAAIGGGVVWFPPGTFPLASSLQIGARNSVTFRGSGVDATILQSTSPTAPVFFSNAQGRYRVFEDMTLSSSVTKTAGPLMYFFQEIRTIIRHVRIRNHFDGIQVDAFDTVLIDFVQINDPSGPGTAIIAGKLADTPQGAGLIINNSVLRGGDAPDGNGPNITGLVGVRILDVDAVVMFNTDMSAFRQSGMVIAPSTRSFNHHFVQSFFDATVEGPSIDVGGPGAKQQITMTGNWIASSGLLGTPSAEKARNAVGIRFRAEGTYGPWNITGGRVYNTLGRGIEVLTPSIQLALNGVQFETLGLGNVPGANESLFVNTAFNQPSVNVSGCTFYRSSNGPNILTGGSANLFSIASTYGEGRMQCSTRPVLNQANVFLGGSAGCN